MVGVERMQWSECPVPVKCCSVGSVPWTHRLSTRCTDRLIEESALIAPPPLAPCLSNGWPVLWAETRGWHGHLYPPLIPERTCCELAERHRR